MLYINKARLESLLSSRGLNIARLARLCGVSRQSIYNMFGRTSVFNTAFEKILAHLGIDHKTITEEIDRPAMLMKKFPDKIKKITLKLTGFAEEHHADLILFGSRAAGKTAIRHDFDFAMFFHRKIEDRGLNLLRHQLADEAFPYRVDVINLNKAPEWFKTSIEDNMIYIRKEGEK